MAEPRLDLMCEVGELSTALAGSADSEKFLFRLCEIVAGHLKAEVCPTYLLEDKSLNLVRYLLAEDRGNEKVSGCYCLHCPAMLRTLAGIAAAAARAGREVIV